MSEYLSTFGANISAEMQEAILAAAPNMMVFFDESYHLLSLLNPIIEHIPYPPEEMIGKTLEELKAKIGGPIGGLHLVHCGGRRAGIDARIDEVTEQIKKSVGDIPFIVEFTFGEYGYEDDGNNTCGGLMLSFTAFGK